MHLLPVSFGLITLSLVLLAAIRLDGHEGRFEASNELAEAWKQPDRIANLFPEPISRSRWQFDFEVGEELLGELRFTADREIALDEATLILMKRLYDWQRAPENADVDLARVRFLISRFFPNTTCHHSFSDLFDRFSAFEESRRLLVSSLRAEEPSARANLPDEEIFRLQARFFSQNEIEGLFARQNRLTRYLRSRSRIIANEDLSDAQRKQAIEELGFDNEIDPDKALRNGPCR